MSFGLKDNSFALTFKVHDGEPNAGAWNRFLNLANLLYLDAYHGGRNEITVEAVATEVGAAGGAAGDMAASGAASAASGAAADNAAAGGAAADNAAAGGAGAAIGGLAQDSAVEGAMEETLASSVWAQALEEFADEEPEVTAALKVLLGAHALEPSHIGAEVEGIATVVSWSNQQVALVYPGEAADFDDATKPSCSRSSIPPRLPRRTSRIPCCPQPIPSSESSHRIPPTPNDRTWPQRGTAMKASILFANDFRVIKGMEKQTMQFIEKLRENPANPSLRVKPLRNAVDRRVRTARVTDQYRAVLFELDGADQRHFMLIRIDNHDEANNYAARLRLRHDPSNGAVVIVVEPDPEDIDAIIDKRAKELAEAELARKRAEELAAAAGEVSKQDPPAESKTETARGVEKPAKAPRDTLAENGIDQQTLATELGISQLSIEATWRAESEDDVLTLLADSPEREKDAILGLLAGLSIAEVAEEIGLAAEPAAGAAEIDDEEIIQQLKKRGLAFEPSEKELKAMWEEGTFQQWRVFLHHSQRQAAFGNHKGSARIVGGAGTGKTVVLVHRAKYLLEKYPKSKVLLTTFTRGLANQLKTLMTTLDPAYPEAGPARRTRAVDFRHRRTGLRSAA